MENSFVGYASLKGNPLYILMYNIDLSDFLFNWWQEMKLKSIEDPVIWLGDEIH